MKRLVFMLMACFSPFANASYYDQCASVLAKGVFDSKEVSTDYRAQSDFKEFMCSSAYSVDKEKISNSICRSENSSNERSWGSEVDIVDLLTGSGNAQIHKNFRSQYCSSDKRFNYSAWSAAHCQSTSSYSNNKSLTHTLIKRANPEIVSAWKACVHNNKKSTDLVCYGEEFGELMSFNIEWDHRYASTLAVERFQNPNLKILGNAPTEIHRGNAKFAFERDDKKKHSLIQVSAIENVDGKKVTISCEYAIPPAQCENVIYRKGRSRNCGIEKYLTAKGEVCGVEKYKSKRHESCGAELYREGAGGACGNRTINHRIDGGCSQASTYCRDHFGGSHVLNCDESRGKVRYDCIIPNRCRSPSFGVEVYKECALPDFGVEEYKSCEDPSFGIVYKECRLPEFGVESCAD